jgi:hypothetical protein
LWSGLSSTEGLLTARNSDNRSGNETPGQAFGARTSSPDYAGRIARQLSLDTESRTRLRCAEHGWPAASTATWPSSQRGYGGDFSTSCGRWTSRHGTVLACKLAPAVPVPAATAACSMDYILTVPPFGGDSDGRSRCPMSSMAPRLYRLTSPCRPRFLHRLCVGAFADCGRSRLGEPCR